MLSGTAKRSYRPKRQLFINPRTEADSPLPAQLHPLRFAPPTASTGQGADHALTINAGHLMGAGQFFQLAGIWAASASNFSERKGKIP